MNQIVSLAWEKIESLDLKSVRQKFAFRKGWWWRIRNEPARVEGQYRQFLFLIVSNPEQTVVPWSRDLDDFWHEHILDTAKYAADCQDILGRFIHHNPHLPEGSPSHTKASSYTRRLYASAFGKPPDNTVHRQSGRNGCISEISADSDHSTHHHYHGGHHHDAGSHHAGSHHGDGGHHSADSGGGHSGGHGCGGHGGH